MIKAHLLQVIVIDDIGIGLDEIVRTIEDTDYSDFLYPHVIQTQSADVENFTASDGYKLTEERQQEIANLFSSWQPIPNPPLG